MENPDVVMFGLMSSMRTGNMLFDMCICLLLPLFFERLWHFLRAAARVIHRYLDKVFRPLYRRTIIHRTSSRPYDEGKTTHKNVILQAAIRQYVGRCLEAKYYDGDIKLMSVPDAMGVNSDSDSDDDRGPQRASVVQQLEKKYRPVTLPQKNETVEIEPGLFFCDTEQTDDPKDERGKERGILWTRKEITLSAGKRRGGKERVDGFVERAYKWYMDEVARNEEKGRFMYQPLVQSGAASEGSEKPRLFKRYPLGNEKTFKSLFFPEKEKLQKLLKQFKDKTGKFAIQGVPYRLGLLLHGPPGTGKTSLVKAIANETNRHVVSIQLSRVRTNQELMDIMFDMKFTVQNAGGNGEDSDSDDDGDSKIASRCKFDEVVFLLEDVDAASKVVQTRDAADVDPEEKKKVKELLEQKRREAEKKKTEDSSAAPLAAYSTFDMMYELDKDKLNLAGVLNVLDGVVDSPGRILVMTTNHRERLDPALLRPGRVNLQLFMGHMQPHIAVQMASHYYRTATAADLEKFKATLDDRCVLEKFKLSPAELEQMCAENDTIEQLTAAIREHGNLS